MQGISQRRLLRECARTFSPTLLLLPRELRSPLSLGYLIARAADSVADEDSLMLSEKKRFLESLRRALSWDGEMLSAPVAPRVDRAEALLAALPRLLGELSRHPDAPELVQMLDAILRGMLFDLERFPSADPLSPEELSGYCALVAGSVGRAWCLLVAKRGRRSLTCDPSVVLASAEAYGRGLQMINILRDGEEDRARGRFYLPEENVSDAVGLTRDLLAEGGRFLGSLRPGRILWASSLPLEISLATLRLMSRSRGCSGVRIPRSAVRGILAGGLLRLWLPRVSNPAS